VLVLVRVSLRIGEEKRAARARELGGAGLGLRWPVMVAHSGLGRERGQRPWAGRWFKRNGVYGHTADAKAKGSSGDAGKRPPPVRSLDRLSGTSKKKYAVLPFPEKVEHQLRFP
jgi:hypothetical protein